MILYHFTSELYMPSIMKYGIIKGDVPITPSTGFNAPWFTTDVNAGSQGWEHGSAISKTRIRIKVNLSGSKLKKWSKYAVERGVEDWWYDALDKTGSHGSDNWYIYLGVVPSSKFLEVIDMKDKKPYGETKIFASQVDMNFETPWYGAFNVVKNEENASHKKKNDKTVELFDESDDMNLMASNTRTDVISKVVKETKWIGKVDRLT